MAYTFFGVYFEDDINQEFRCGFLDDDNYQPIIQKRTVKGWEEVNQRLGTGPANQCCRYIREKLPIRIRFDKAHTQNDRMELINQLVYNINRRTNEKTNYGGAHP